MLRKLRERAGLTLSDVEQRTRVFATRRNDRRFGVPKSRLSEIETNGRTPSIYCLHSLAGVYRVDIRTLLAFYRLR